MTTSFRLIQLGQASRLTCAGGGVLLLEENMIFAYDPI
jgi:hypothetical protein